MTFFGLLKPVLKDFNCCLGQILLLYKRNSLFADSIKILINDALIRKTYCFYRFSKKKQFEKRAEHFQVAKW